MARAAMTSRVATAPAGRRAFTFIEILATLTLLAIVLPAVMSGISLSLSTANLAKQQSQAAALGQSKLMELVTAGQWQHAEQAGDFGQDWPNYRWTMQVSDWDSPALRLLDLTVSWPMRGKTRSLTLSTLVRAGETP